MCASRPGRVLLLAALAVAACGPAGGGGDALVSVVLPVGQVASGLTGACEEDGVFSLPACPLFVELTVAGEGVDQAPVRWPERAEELAAEEAELAMTLPSGPAREFRCTAFRAKGDELVGDDLEVFTQVRVEIVDLPPGSSVDVVMRLRRLETVGVRGRVAAGTTVVEVVDRATAVLLLRVPVPEAEPPAMALSHVPTERDLAWTLVRGDGARMTLDDMPALQAGGEAWRTLDLGVE